jgi:uncharacterized paraquat-inducible protein A
MANADVFTERLTERFLRSELKKSVGAQLRVEIPLTSCTECGAELRQNQETCPRCHHPRWYTLKKTSILLLIIVLLVALTKYLVVFVDRTLSQWFG